MATRARAYWFTGHPTQIVEIVGKTDKDREVEMIVPEDMMRRIIIDGAKALQHTNHLGHALWHVKEGHMSDDDFAGCTSCNRL